MASEPRKNGAKGPRILIVDDDPGQRSLLDSFLRSQGFETVPVASGEQALETLRAGGFGMMISDVRMPGISGLETLRLARKEHAVLPVLLVTAYADIRDAVGAMRDGAAELPGQADRSGRAARLGPAGHRPRQARAACGSAPTSSCPPHVMAKSPLMQAVFRDASLIAASESRVLITGESGVGKEVVADVIHAWSPRAPGPLVKVNCAAIPETLLESELFGHEKGAFTGADGAAHRPLRGGQRRHHLPRRNRRDVPAAAGQAAARDAGRTFPARRLQHASSRPTRASWPPPTATWKRRSRRAASARTCSTGSTSWN